VEEHALPAGNPERRALEVAGNDAKTRAIVAEFLDRLGYDPVDAGMLASARAFEIGTPIFEGHWRRDEMSRLVDAAAERCSDWQFRAGRLFAPFSGSSLLYRCPRQTKE